MMTAEPPLLFVKVLPMIVTPVAPAESMPPAPVLFAKVELATLSVPLCMTIPPFAAFSTLARVNESVVVPDQRRQCPTVWTPSGRQ